MKGSASESQHKLGISALTGLGGRRWMLACCPETKGWGVESEEKKNNCDPICNSNIDSSGGVVKSKMAVVPRVAEDKWKEAVAKGMMVQ